jgi:AbrB family looped-hinge helix DNA binding protein
MLNLIKWFNMVDVLVTRKGQVTVPVAFRRKFGIKQGMKISMEETPSGVLITVIPSFYDLIGADADKKDLNKTLENLDKMKAEDWY